MLKKFTVLFFLCLCPFVIVGCGSRKPPIVQQGVEQLGPSGYGFRNPVWSPDGTKIVVTTQTVVSSWTSKIYVLEVSNGKAKKIMETDSGSVLAVSWSPDGEWILLASGKGGDWPEGIWKIRADGKTSPEFLVNGYEASWSPDGNKIVFVSNRDRNPEIYIMNSDGSEQKRLTYSYFGSEYPIFSADGNKIYFASKRDNNIDVNGIRNNKLYVMNSDGTNV